MRKDVEYAIFTISTDFFCPLIFNQQDNDVISKIKSISRTYVKRIMDEETNFFLHPRFGLNNSGLKTLFIRDCDESGIPKEIVERLHSIFNSLDKEEKLPSEKAAIFEIALISSDLLSMQFSEFLSEINTELKSIAQKISDIRISYGSRLTEIDPDDWLASETPWDKYIISIMDDVPETIFDCYEKMTNCYTEDIDYILEWQQSLNNEEFRTIKEFIVEEAARRLQPFNEDAARKVADILDTITLPSK